MLKHLITISALVSTLVNAVPTYNDAPVKTLSPLLAPALPLAAAPYPLKLSALNGLAGGFAGGFGPGILLAGAPLAAAAVASPIYQAAILSQHAIHHYEVPSHGYVQPTNVEVSSNNAPINLLFRSSSSPLNIKQYHEGLPGSAQETQSEDEPHRLVHSVIKPVLQEVREIIVPMRRVTQEITPVQEEIQTIVARGNGAGPALANGAALAAGPGLAAGPALAGGPGALIAGPGALVAGPGLAAGPGALLAGPGQLQLLEGSGALLAGPGQLVPLKGLKLAAAPAPFLQAEQLVPIKLSPKVLPKKY
ncbi:DFP2-like protein 23 [Sarcoptes scabiei]|uniref:DFP2-like protein 23 n=1 Tax=Sarcoptes scabiei TaxID=52283 RepID=A0A132A6W2_SARSC|nr:DFP2-like protein 23 [Sarcoptes scabiei]